MSGQAWNRVTAAALGERARQKATAVLRTLASTEQHGSHRPTGADDILAAEVCARGATVLATHHPVAIAPGVGCRPAERHTAFGRTFTLSAPLSNLCSSILRAGLGKILIANRHGGNVNGLTAVAGDLSRELDVLVGCTTDMLSAPETTRHTMEHQDTVLHACEAETSIGMAIAPNLVLHHRRPDAHGAALGFTTELTGPIDTVRWFTDMTASGVAGDERSTGAGSSYGRLPVAATALVQL